MLNLKQCTMLPSMLTFQYHYFRKAIFAMIMTEIMRINKVNITVEKLLYSDKQIPGKLAYS